MSLEALKEKIRSLEAERDQLANEVQIMQKAAENRIVTLEKDIKLMSEESKSLRELLLSSERMGTAPLAAKPAPSSTVDVSTKPTPEIATQTTVQEKTSSQTVAPKLEAPSTTEAIPQPSVAAVHQIIPGLKPQEELQPEESEIQSETSSKEDVFRTLSPEEKKVVDVLCDHGGRYARTSIRTEAGLSWLQSNRIISHLAERGIVSLEKNGASMEVVLKEKP
jgi:uncharacterized membrane protein